MIAQAVAENPLECCGLLAGKIDPSGTFAEATRRYPLVNTLASSVEFLSGPEIFAATRDMRLHGIEIIAIYHSHPTSPPIPSRKDLERNFYGSTAMHLIISLAGSVPEMRGWWLFEDDYRQGEILLTD